MTAAFLVMAIMAAIWSAIKSEIVRRSIIDSLPPQFQDSLASRYAVDVYALSHPTPLELQAEYVKSVWGGCVAFACGSLCFFSIQQPIIGCLGLIVFLVSVFQALKARRTYKANCDRPVAQHNQDDGE